MKFKNSYLYTIVLLFFICSKSSIYAQNSKNKKEEKSEWKQEGTACIYSKGLNGGKTANGGRLDMDALTAAHLKLPFGTKVKVTNVKNGKSVVVKITDRGPYSKKFIIDLTSAAAKKLGFSYSEGIAKVRITKV
jgi:rare lipoprotein A